MNKIEYIVLKPNQIQIVVSVDRDLCEKKWLTSCQDCLEIVRKDGNLRRQIIKKTENSLLMYITFVWEI